MAEHNALPGLLRIPRELRDHIIFQLLDERTEPPQNPSFPGERTSQLKGPGRTGGRSFSIRYPNNVMRCQYTGLLRTSRQIRAETREVIDKRLASPNITAELDIMFKGYVSWPTWIHFPLYVRPSTRAEIEKDPNLNVNVHLRIFSTEGFYSSDGWPRQPGEGFRDLFMLLLQFIEFGPDFGHSGSQYDNVSRLLSSIPDATQVEDQTTSMERQFRMKTLSVHLTFHDIYTPATHPMSVHQIFKSLKELALSGFFCHTIQTIRARAKFAEKGQDVEWDNQWPVNKVPSLHTLSRWHDVGLIEGGEHGAWRLP